MCGNCFLKEYYKFNTYEEFETFLEEFDSKIAKTILFIGTEKYKTDFHNIYQCTSCKQIWWLSEPDNHWRGYFLKEINAKREINNDEKKGKQLKYGCLIIIAFILFFLVKSCIY